MKNEKQMFLTFALLMTFQTYPLQKLLVVLYELIFSVDSGGRNYLWHVLQPRTLKSTYLLPLKPQVSYVN